MSRIVMAVFGSLGDLHPFIALALELRERGHQISFATSEVYREKIQILGFDFHAVRPDIDPNDFELARDLMDAKKGTERIIRELLMPSLRDVYADLSLAAKDADLMIAGEVVYAAPILADKTGLPWISTSLAPISFTSAHDPFVPPTQQWFGSLRFLGAGVHRILISFAKKTVRSWGEPAREFRRELGLDADIDPIFDDKYSRFLHLALFSRVLGEPQPDWHQPTVQTGFAFYDGKKDLGKMPDGLREFLAAGEPPIVFTLGSAAVWVAGDFFHESAAAAKKLKRRAVLILGENKPPENLGENIAAFDYAPYGEVFPHAACVVHQAGIGTTSQVLRAGVPHLIMPFSHDQPDNAARCARLGVARTISRESYTAERAARELGEILGNVSYKNRALEAKRVVDSENGVKSACNEIEELLKRGKS